MGAKSLHVPPRSALSVPSLSRAGEGDKRPPPRYTTRAVSFATFSVLILRGRAKGQTTTAWLADSPLNGEDKSGLRPYDGGMAKKLRWGVLSTANIGIKKVIPGMQRGERTRVDAIASRDLNKAQEAAGALGIPKAYGSYEELLADPEIDAVYNPLPNHLHVPWSVRCAEAGKHVLCEKPVALDASEARTLLAAQSRTGAKIGEAF